MNASHHQDRRQHVVYITKNTEYHCRGQECVGVRSRTNAVWQPRHVALRQQLLGALDATNCMNLPEVGTRLLFGYPKPQGKICVVTSEVVASCRPPKESIYGYVNLIKSGTIT